MTLKPTDRERELSDIALDKDKKVIKKQFEYEKMTLIVKDKLGVKHQFGRDKDTLYVLQNKFEAAGVNFMSFLIENAEQKPIILKP